MRQISSAELREMYQRFFESKGHVRIPSAPLVPENDPTTLFTGSGMQPLVPYLLGQSHPAGKKLVDSQKSFRAEDIEETGDNRHTTFFEMLGNWSLGDYFKQEQLLWSFSFLIDEIGLDPNKLYVTVFGGDESVGIPKDTEAVGIWQKLFSTKSIEAKAVELETSEKGSALGMQGGRIFYYGAKKNWWSRSGVPANMPAGEPGGTDSEMFYEFTSIEHNPKFGEHCHPNCDCGRFMEIGNSVFMEYQKNADGTFSKLSQRNVDFGGGLERIAAARRDNADVFTIDLLQVIIAELEKKSGKKYGEAEFIKSFRIIADHLRAATFMIDAGVRPSNTDRGYILRRLIRRMVQQADKLGLKTGSLADIYQVVADEYKTAYPSVLTNIAEIKTVATEEENKFRKTLMAGLREFTKLSTSDISGRDAFVLFTSYGFPLELTLDLAAEKGLKVDTTEFNAKMDKHREQSRTAAAAKFKGGLADQSEQSVKYHTATHLLHQALRQILGGHVAQKGSNITLERLRFDFSHPQKMTPEEIKKVEELLNEKIQSNLPVTREEMTVPEAKAKGALGLFEHKYQERVSVYTVGDFSCEICGGPHVQHTGELGQFRIIKEESASAGVRRIKAVLE